MSTATDRKNARTSAREVKAFTADKPDRYFAYGFAKPSGLDPVTRLWYGDKIGTWTGDKLAAVTECGAPYRSGFGDLRQSFRALAINGETYSGTAYLSAGDYVRMRRVKG